MRAKKRQPAHFKLTGRSSVMGTYNWNVTIDDQGVVAKRDADGRRVSIDWRTLIGAAMFHGLDSARTIRDAGSNGA